jgi:CRISPR-associated endonuclease/helicase Cas3
MSPLTSADFSQFHQEVYGFSPFPWQCRLVAQVLQERRFPDLIDIPTGVGKTTLMDIAVFALAVDATGEPSQRWMPRRIFLVVDRRVIVDQAGERALGLSRRLAAAHSGNASTSMLSRVARALSSLSGGGEPLVPAILRGGTLRDDGWARRPDQPILGASTVDQVGSRILFSGYGVSGRSASIHAGLLGRDTLFLLDEVHLSRPFRDTLRAVKQYSSEKWCQALTGVSNQFVELSATPEVGSVEDDRTVFGLDANDRSHPLIQERLGASKRVELLETASGGLTAFVGAFVKESREMVQKHRTLGVVVNRVASARAVCQALQPLGDRKGFDVYLVTGRMRALDRQDLLDRIGPRIRAGRTRSAEDRPLILVATQCIEAGADLDFDALITECASLDALKQRFGRVDRLGRYGHAEGVIIARKTDVSASGGDDPVYGHALRATWNLLSEVRGTMESDERLDFGLDSLALISGVDGVSAPTHPAPIMLPAHLDAWAQTAPAPAVRPEISLWLHGPEERSRDVQIVWRADLAIDEIEAVCRSVSGAERLLEQLIDRIAFVPPSSPETLSVPLVAARAWLSSDGNTETDVADVEGMRDEEGRPKGGIRPVIVWEGDRTRIVTHPRDIRPGMTLVVPSVYGGITMGTWDPAGLKPVHDLAERAQLLAHGRVTVRLHPDLWGGHPTPPSPPLGDEDRSVADEFEAIEEWLGLLTSGAGAAPWQILAHRELTAVGNRGRGIRAFTAANGQTKRWWGVALKRRLPIDVVRELRELERLAASSSLGISIQDATGTLPNSDLGLEHFIEDFDSVEHSSFTSRRVELTAHQNAVAEKVREFARNLALTRDLEETLWWAGRVHDVGKADRRFQLWLHGGDEIELAASGRELAKSKIPQQERGVRSTARERSGYPRGLRHEMASVAMLSGSDPLLASVPDPDLFLHLVASHHGWARPFAPVIVDNQATRLTYRLNEPIRVELSALSNQTLAAADSGVAARFWRLNRRFGWHGLAYLESLLRLADHRVSDEEENA